MIISSPLSVKNRIIYRNKCVLMMQRWVRGYLARKRHQPRISGVRKLGALKLNLSQMENIAKQLKKDSDLVVGNVRSTAALLDKAILQIKTNLKITQKEIDALCETILSHVNKQSAELNVKLQEQKNAEEQERLRKIQMQMEAERRIKEEAERKQREEEENRRL